MRLLSADTDRASARASSGGWAVRLVPLLALIALLVLPGPALARIYTAIVIDADSGMVLYSSRADRKVYPASLTKMMTLYLTFDALKSGRWTRKTRLRVSRRAAGQAPSKLGLKAGSTITVEDAILALVTKSANDAATVIAEALGGSEVKFGQMMTARARELGMRNTTFRNASGLPNRAQRSTARDMALLAQALLRDHPQYYSYFSRRSFSYRGRRFANHNRLLASYDGVDGIKTGYIRASGFNLVASASRNGRRLIGVVFGGKSAKSRDAQMTRLLDDGFRKLKERGLMVAFPPPPMAPKRKIQSPEAQLALARRPNRLPSDAPTAPLAAAARAGWGIQVGAFRDKKRAEEAVLSAARRAPSLLRLSRAAIEPLQTGSRLIYRARLIGVSEQQAREACRILESRRQNCLPVQAKIPG